MQNRIFGVLNKKFNLSSFRTGQEEIIQSILNGKDRLVIMPTGGGKSLCYQLPALILDGVTIVISPLIALMKDQVDALVNLAIPATYINSTLSIGESQQRIEGVRKGEYKLLYIAPERFYSAPFMKLINQINVSPFQRHLLQQLPVFHHPAIFAAQNAVLPSPFPHDNLLPGFHFRLAIRQLRQPLFLCLHIQFPNHQLWTEFSAFLIFCFPQINLRQNILNFGGQTR